MSRVVVDGVVTVGPPGGWTLCAASGGRPPIAHRVDASGTAACGTPVAPLTGGGFKAPACKECAS